MKTLKYLFLVIFLLSNISILNSAEIHIPEKIEINEVSFPKLFELLNSFKPEEINTFNFGNIQAKYNIIKSILQAMKYVILRREMYERPSSSYKQIIDTFDEILPIYNHLIESNQLTKQQIVFLKEAYDFILTESSKMM